MIDLLNVSQFEQQLCKLRKNNQSGTGTTKHTFYKVIFLVPNTIINFLVYAFETVEREQQNVPQFIIIS